MIRSNGISIIPPQIPYVSLQVMECRKRRRRMRQCDQQLSEIYLGECNFRSGRTILQQLTTLIFVGYIIQTTISTTSHDRQRNLSCSRLDVPQRGNNALACFSSHRSSRYDHRSKNNYQRQICRCNQLRTDHDHRRTIVAPFHHENVAFIIDSNHARRLGEQQQHSRQYSTLIRLFDATSAAMNDGPNELDIIEHDQFDTEPVATPNLQHSTTTILSAEPSFNGDSSSSTTSKQFDILQATIVQQQRQIDTILEILQQQHQTPSSSTSNSFVNDEKLYYKNNPFIQQQLFQPLASATDDETSYAVDATTSSDADAVEATTSSTHFGKKLKAMLFIDGTWLYYSINERLAKDVTLIQKYGRGWQFKYDIDWSKLPRILSTMLQNELNDNDRSLTSIAQKRVEVDVVRCSAYTSYKADTPTTSYRYKLFQDLKKANYFVQMMETVGKSEKCVDIQLAVEVLHYATLDNPANSYDIALLLTGDKDLMPAIIRARCKGKQVGLVSMRPGCNRALVDTPGLLSFDVIWMEDLLDQLLIPRVLDDEIEKSDIPECTSGVSMYTLHKVVHDFIRCAPVNQVSSRDLGRYLKQIRIDGVGGSSTLLDTMKRYYGGMHQYLSTMGHYDIVIPSFLPGTTDHSYVISLSKANGIHSDDDDDVLSGNDGDVIVRDDDDDDNFLSGDSIDAHRLTESEKQFFSKHSADRLIHDQHNLYSYSLDVSQASVLETNSDVSNRPNSDEDTLSIKSILKVIDDFIFHSDYERIILSDLDAYLNHLRVTPTCSILDDIKRMHGGTLSFLKSKKGYSITDSGKSTIRKSYWVQITNKDEILEENDSMSDGASARNFFRRYTIEPLIINRQRWYCDTISALQGDINTHQNPVLPSPSYNDMAGAELKLACREMGLAVSGTKSVLLERIQHYIESEKCNGSNEPMELDDENIIPERFLCDPSSSHDYLRNLVTEYLQAKGGIAYSRQIGRYLAANKASNRGKINALQEMKSQYGSLNTFVDNNPDLFDSTKDGDFRNNINDGNDGALGNFGFHVKLKKK